MIQELWGFHGLTCDVDFFLCVLQIIVINLILSGDNAVVIALAVKSLPRRKRIIGILLGAGFAVILRIVLTFFAAQLMLISYVKLIGGILIFWIACKLLLEDVSETDEGKEALTVWSAVWIIFGADVTMSTDNILALAGASKGSLILLIFGLVTSIALVVFTSTLLARLMDRYPIIVYLGAAVLGKVSAEMIFTDPAAEAWFQLPETAIYFLEAIFAVGVIIIARFYTKYIKSDEKAVVLE